MRKDYEAVYGMGGKYALTDCRMLTYRGTARKYEDFKNKLAMKNG